MKARVLFLSFIILGFLYSCEDDNKNETVIIRTDKDCYSIGEEVKVEIINNCESILEYYICSSYTGIPPLFLKYENDEWTGFWSPICDAYLSHCCGEFEPHDKYEDIFNLEFEKGIYKIEYSFFVEHGEGYQSFYSNEFRIE